MPTFVSDCTYICTFLIIFIAFLNNKFDPYLKKYAHTPGNTISGKHELLIIIFTLLHSHFSFQTKFVIYMLFLYWRFDIFAELNIMFLRVKYLISKSWYTNIEILFWNSWNWKFGLFVGKLCYLEKGLNIILIKYLKHDYINNVPSYQTIYNFEIIMA